MAAGWNLALFYLRTLVEVDWKGKDQSIAKLGDANEVKTLRGFRQGYLGSITPLGDQKNLGRFYLVAPTAPVGGTRCLRGAGETR